MRGERPRFDYALIRLAFAPRPDASVADRRPLPNGGYWPKADIRERPLPPQSGHPSE